MKKYSVIKRNIYTAYLRNLCNFFLIILPISRWFKLKHILLRLASIDIKSGASVNGGCKFLGRGGISIGNSTWIGPFCTFYSHIDAAIIIGNRCDIAPEVSFVTGSHELGSPSRRAGLGFAKPIHIGDGCWIGVRSVILGGVVIGEGAMIAAGSVVTRNVAKNSMVGGVPARFIKEL